MSNNGRSTEFIRYIPLILITFLFIVFIYGGGLFKPHTVYAASANPASCQEIKTASPGAMDGNYTITLYGTNVQVYCHNMNTTPTEYINLQYTGGGFNFSRYAVGGATAGDSVVTSFTKVRLDPVNLRILNYDFTFSTSTGHVYPSYEGYWSCENVSQMPYAAARDCLNFSTTSGSGNIDLRSTPFYVTTGQFAASGYYAAGNANYSNNNQVVDIHGGGFPGHFDSGEFLMLQIVQDTTAPILTLNGASTVYQGVKTAYSDLGAAATDNYDASVTVTSTSTVNVDVVGNYTVTYTATDAVGNATSVTRSVIVEDKTAPILTLNGASTVYQGVKTAYSDLGAAATDNYDASVSVTLTSTVNVNVIGTYTVTYTAADAAGNATSVTRSVIVQDKSAPVITLNGTSTVYQGVKTAYSDLGATATDNYDTSISVTSTSTVNVDVVGTYTVTYSAMDAAQNAAATVTRTVYVRDKTSPVLILNGESTVYQEVKTAYSDLGAVATDNYDASVSVTPSSTVDVDIVGTYTVTYSAMDAAQNPAATVTRTVYVRDTTVPILTLNGENTVYQEVKMAYSDLGAAATDNYNTSVNVTPTSTVNVDVVGTYTVIYTAKDAAGNTTSVTRKVVVQDTTAPILTLNGESTVYQEVKTAYNDLGATATDNYDTSVSVTPTSTVNEEVIGTYTVTYSAVDAAQNAAATVTRTVYVKDTLPPVILFSQEGQETPSLQVTVGITSTDSSSKLSSLEYEWTNTSETPTTGWLPVPANGEGVLSGVTGDWYLHVRAVDWFGNLSIKHSNRFRLYVLSGDAQLSGVSVVPAGLNSPIGLNEMFQPDRYNYTASVTHEVYFVRVVPVLSNAFGTLTIQTGGRVQSVSEAVYLNVGANPIDISVQAQNGNHTTYQITVNRMGSDNADISRLLYRNEPVPQSDKDFTLTIGSNTDQVTLQMVLSDPRARLSVSQAVYDNQSINFTGLQFGNNTFVLEVLAEDGQTRKTYRLNIIRSNVLPELLSAETDISGKQLRLIFTKPISSSVQTGKMKVESGNAQTIINQAVYDVSDPEGRTVIVELNSTVLLGEKMLISLEPGFVTDRNGQNSVALLHGVISNKSRNMDADRDGTITINDVVYLVQILQDDIGDGKLGRSDILLFLKSIGTRFLP